MRWDVHNKTVKRSRHGDPHYRNPLFVKQTWQAHVVAHFGAYALGILLFVLTLGYVVLYSPWLQISNVTIQGDPTVAAAIRDRHVNWFLEQRRATFFRQNNILTVDLDWLKEIIGREYDLTELTVTRDFPHGLAITVAVKPPLVIWVTRDQRYYVGNDGAIASAVSDTGDGWMAVHDESGTAVIPGQSVFAGDKLQCLRTLLTELPSRDQFLVTAYRTLAAVSPQLNAVTDHGYTLNFDCAEDVNAQLMKLDQVFREGLVEKNNPTEYIDLRVGDRVYMK